MLENKVREMYKAIFEEMVMPVIDKVIEEESANTEVLIREAIAKKMGTVNLALPSSKAKVEKPVAVVEEKVNKQSNKTTEDIEIEKDIMEDLKNFEETVSKKTTKSKETAQKPIEAVKVEEKVEDSFDLDLDLDDVVGGTESESKAEVVSKHLVSNDDDLDLLFEG